MSNQKYTLSPEGYIMYNEYGRKPLYLSRSFEVAMADIISKLLSDGGYCDVKSSFAMDDSTRTLEYILHFGSAIEMFSFYEGLTSVFSWLCRYNPHLRMSDSGYNAVVFGETSFGITSTNLHPSECGVTATMLFPRCNLIDEVQFVRAWDRYTGKCIDARAVLESSSDAVSAKFPFSRILYRIDHDGITNIRTKKKEEL